MSVVAGWRSTRLKNLFRSVRNGTWGDDPNGVSDVFCARGTDFDRTTNRIDDAKMPRRSVAPAALRQHLLLRGDLVLEKSGGSADQPVGSVALFDLAIPTVASNFNARMQVASDVDPRFACYLLNGLYWSGFTRQFVNQTTGIQNLDANALLAQHCDVPPLDEQRRIADFLDAEASNIDNMVELTSALVNTSELRKDAGFSLAVKESGGPALDLLDVDCAAHDGWRCARLSKVLSKLTNGYVGPTRDILVDRPGVPYIQSLHIKNGRIEFERKPYYVQEGWASARPRITLAEGDLLIVQTGAVGEVALVDDRFQGASCHALLIARAHPNIADEHYLLHMLRGHFGRHLLLREQTGALHPHLEAGKVRDISIPVPSLKVQKSIAARCKEYNAHFAAIQASAMHQQALLAERRHTLITAAVTGQIDVTTARGAAA